MRYRFIDNHTEGFHVGTLCRALDVSRSAYYHWRDGGSLRRQERDQQLLVEIRDIYARSRRTYGSPRIWSELRDRGLSVSRKRVARLMRLAGLRAKTKRRFRITTHSRHRYPVAADLLQQNFRAEDANHVWTSDITYLWTEEGWLYLAVVLDVYSRLVVGWEVSDRLTRDLVRSALQRAVESRRPAQGLIFHSDQGSQYASHQVQELLQQHGIAASMSRRGNCYGNAITESFFHTLKTELTYFHRYATRQEARISIFDYIELFYNRQRRHSSLGNLSPMDYELHHAVT